MRLIENLRDAYLDGYRARALYHMARRNFKHFDDTKDPHYLDISDRLSNREHEIRRESPKGVLKVWFKFGEREADRRNDMKSQIGPEIDAHFILYSLFNDYRDRVRQSAKPYQLEFSF